MLMKPDPQNPVDKEYDAVNSALAGAPNPPRGVGKAKSAGMLASRASVPDVLNTERGRSILQPPVDACRNSPQKIACPRGNQHRK